MSIVESLSVDFLQIGVNNVFSQKMLACFTVK